MSGDGEEWDEEGDDDDMMGVMGAAGVDMGAAGME